MAYREIGGLGDFKPAIKSSDKLKFEPERKYRVGFPCLTENGTVRVDRVFFFNKFEEGPGGLKLRTLLTDDEGFNKQVAKRMGEAQYRYCTPAILYKCDAQGKPVKPFDYEIKPFVFSDQTYADLVSINDEFPISEHDILLALKEKTDPKFQNLSIFPTSKASLWSQVKDKDKIVAQANEVTETMAEAVAPKKDKQFIAEKLGIPLEDEEPAQQSGGGVDVDIDDIDDLV